MIFDTHAHYDDEAFDGDREELLSGLAAGGIGTVVNVATVVVGSLLGILPGGGAALASFGSYMMERRMSKGRHEFGTGAIEGVAGPEAANNAAAAGILGDLGVEKVRLLTNNTDKVNQLRALGLDIVEQVPLLVGVGPNNHQYLETKRDRMGHIIGAAELEAALAQGTDRTPHGQEIA